MNKYIIKYILYTIGVVLFVSTFIDVIIGIALEGFCSTWIATVILVSYLACMTHIISSAIYDDNKDPKSNFHVSKAAIGIIFMISTLSQIICMAISIIEAYKKFGDISPVEYLLAAFFMLASAYAYKKASYKLIKKEKKDEQ